MARKNDRSSGTAAPTLFKSERTGLPVTIEMPESAACARVERQGTDEAHGPYSAFYRALGSLREEFHRIGRFDDANAKLDELCKLLVLKTLDTRHPLPAGGSRLSIEHLQAIAERMHGSPSRLAAAMHTVFDDLGAQFPDEFGAFGPRRSLNIHADDDEFARAILPLLDALPHIDDAHVGAWSFDSVNEAFGHFVQDSFRNRKEDAQYMTPPEVVSAMVEIVLNDIVQAPDFAERSEPLLIGDPTCGVGSFLAAAYRHASQIEVPNGKLSDRLQLFGQDKVERMARLATVNLKIFARSDAHIRVGNSIMPPTSMEDVAGRFDAILTNPPFGATFDVSELLAKATPNNLPTLFAMARSRSLPKALDSEYILLDRELAMLRPGGRLLMVVPDHVVSGSGFSEEFRLEIAKRYELVAVLDLPAETFAQAGTRTKTSVVYLRRPDKPGVRSRTHVFMASADDLGFRVVSRAGASVKRMIGTNEMPLITAGYMTFSSASAESADVVCLSTEPSIAAVSSSQLLNNRWTAGFYRTGRLAALQHLEQSLGPGASLLSLGEVVDIDPDSSERVLPNADNRCISVLHVREDGSIDLAGVDAYRPTTACVRCRPGDVLVSKINPRIVRIAVVPATPWHVGCSPEFAVLRCRGDQFTPWSLALLLRSSVVQSQIRTLTSGTSSSHNRIKDRDLEVVRLPVPAPGTSAFKSLRTFAAGYEKSMKDQYAAQRQINECFHGTELLLGTAKTRG